MTGNECIAGIIKVKIGLIMEEIEKLSKSNEPLKIVEDDPRVKIIVMLEDAHYVFSKLILTDSENQKVLEEYKKLKEKQP